MAGGGNYDSRIQIGAGGNGFASESVPIPTETRKTRADGGACQTRRPETDRLGWVVASIHHVAVQFACPAKRKSLQGHYGTQLGRVCCSSGTVPADAYCR